MAFSYRIDPSRQLVTVVLSGSVHGHEIAETMETLYRDPAWTAGFDILWDGTTIAELLFEQADIPNFVRLQVQYAFTRSWFILGLALRQEVFYPPV